MEKLFIQTKFARPGFKRLFRIKRPVQDKRFEVGIKITNIGDLVVDGTKIKQISIKSTEGNTLTHHIPREFLIKTLNPGDSQTVWLDMLHTHLNGTAWLRFKLDPGPDRQIHCYQDTGAPEPGKCKDANTWENSFLVESHASYTQRRTNSLLLVLAVLQIAKIGIPVPEWIRAALGFVGAIFNGLGGLFIGLTK